MIATLLSAVAGWIIGVISSSGYLGIFLLMTVESAGIPAPSEVIMPFSGYLVSAGKINFWLVALAGTFGNLLGSLIAYAVGYYGRRPIIERYGKYILLSKHELDLADRFFSRRGSLTVFVGRLLPIIRTYISFPAGIARMPLKPFIIYTTIGAFLWSALLTQIGVKLGQNWQTLKEYAHGLDVAVAVVLVLAAGYFVYSRRKK